jgi:hypothetical protein
MYGIKVLIEVDGKGVKSDWVTAVLKTGSFLGFMTIVSPFLLSYLNCKRCCCFLRKFDVLWYCLSLWQATTVCDILVQICCLNSKDDASERFPHTTAAAHEPVIQ